LWSWSKVFRRVALDAEVRRFFTHATRHLCLTDLARMGWEVHAIATFAGHRSTDSTLRYVHRSGGPGREAELLDGACPRLAGLDAHQPSRVRGVGVNAAAAASAEAQQDSDRQACALSAGRAWDRRRELLDSEADAIAAIGPVGLRRNRATGISRRTARHWQALARLTEGLDAARAALRHGDDATFRRAGAQGAAIILQHCAATGRSWRAWTDWDWARLCGSSAEEFLAGRTLPAERTVGRFLVALAYLLGGLTGFHDLGNFNPLHLARLVFGGDAVEESLRRAGEVLDQWGCRDPLRSRHRLRGTFSQALLINRSPRLEDLTTEAFAVLRGHPAAAGHQGEMLYAPQRAVAAVGFCDPPVRTGRNNAPGIDGTSPAWATLVERRHATSALTPRVRATVGTILIKAGRWLAAEHPRSPNPGTGPGRPAPRLGRRCRPDGGRRLRAALGPCPRPCREADLPAHQVSCADGDPDVLPRLPGTGLVPAPVRQDGRHRLCSSYLRSVPAGWCAASRTDGGSAPAACSRAAWMRSPSGRSRITVIAPARS
jgi:hypothetical protein